MIDLGIVVAYFVIIFVIGLRARAGAGVGPEEYFLSLRSLRWPSIAMSTIATNISAGHFLSVTGAAYVDGLAQGNFELNAIFGIVIAAFFFVPLYLRLRVVTITQFFEQRFGPRVALAYAVLMIVLYALLYLGTALFWAAYALDGIFGEMVAWISDREAVRLAVLIVALGMFSAVYTYLGGLRAVLAPLAVDQATARCSYDHESGGNPPAAVSTTATNTRRVTSRPVKMSLRANRLLTRRACMAGVLVSRPNRKARCGRTKL